MKIKNLRWKNITMNTHTAKSMTIITSMVIIMIMTNIMRTAIIIIIMIIAM